MTVLEKNGHLFLTGMFWQMPDEGKRNINFSKLVKDTGNNMYCRTKKIVPTWGFCKKDVIPKGKKVASLGQFIVESSNVDQKTPNSIIAYKFKTEPKSENELTTNNKTDSSDKELFGYIVFMNGTICPDDGEFVSDILSLRINILKKLRKYDIKRLDLPLDAAEKLFNIYERLTIAYPQPEILFMLFTSASSEEKKQLENMVNQNAELAKYKQLFSAKLGSNLDFTDNPDQIIELLRKLTREPAFVNKRQNSREEKDDLYVLPEKITIAPLTSEQIYWSEKNFKANFNKALIKPMGSVKKERIKLILGFVLLGIISYYAFGPKKNDDLPFMPAKPQPIVPLAVLPQQLINACLIPNDKFFTDLGHWTLMNLKCNSIGYKLNFTSSTDTTLDDFINLTGDKTAFLSGKNGSISKKFKLNPGKLANANSREEIISNLQAKAISLGIKLQLPSSPKDNKFTLTSKLSPVYLVKNGFLNNVKVTEISMNFEQSTGYYNWTIKGEF